MALSAQLRDLITFSQAHSGKLSITNERFRLSELVFDVVDAYIAKAKAKGIDLTVHGSDNTTPVVSDPTRIYQILNNLLGNALKYTESGEISVVIKPFNANDEVFCFDVVDTGRGIPGNQLDSIFLPYTRISGIGVDQEGLGIGLTIVKMVVDCLDGKINVSSTVGVGTTFSVAIPAIPATLKSTPKNLTIEASHHILVVDDREDILEGVECVVTNLGFICDKASSAAAAEKLLSLKKYFFILIDLDMPVKNGYELGSEIRRGNGINRTTQLYAFSAGSREAIGNAWPFNGFLHKPVTGEAIRRVALNVGSA